MKKTHIICIVLISTFIFSYKGKTNPAYSIKNKKVLLIFSYHAEYFWVEEELRGVDTVFQNKELLIEHFYMDTKRNTDQVWMKKVADEAVVKIDTFNPDLVIVFDDNACEYVARQYIGKSLPVVFCGINAEPTDYGFPAPNITGVVEREHWQAGADLLVDLADNIQTLAVISDSSVTSQRSLKQMKQLPFTVEIKEVFLTNQYDTWKEKVEELQTSVDALCIQSFFTIKENSVTVNPDDVLEWTLENSWIPEFSILDFVVRSGALCGVVDSGFDQGKIAAEIAMKILLGEDPADIPIIYPPEGQPLINKERAQSLNIYIPDEFQEYVISE